MSPVTVGELLGAFAVALGIAAIWLLIAYAIPPLRRRPRVSYIVAMILVICVALIPYGGPTGSSVGGAILCIALLYWQMGRAERQLAAKLAADGKK